MHKNLEYTVKFRFLNHKEITKLSSEYNKAFNDHDANKLTENIIQLNIEQIVNSEILNAVYKKIEACVIKILNVSDISLAKVWLVKTQSNDSNPNILPYLPHFDKDRYFKAMIYLHDVGKDHGPIYFGKLHDPAQINIRRKSLPKNYKILNLNLIQKNQLRIDMKPMLGKKGDVIFFDTNAAHCAGVVTKGFERKVIRFDFKYPGYETRPSLIHLFLNNLFSKNKVINKLLMKK